MLVEMQCYAVRFFLGFTVHVLCLPSDGVNSQCRSVYGKGVSIADIGIIVNGHNNFRNDIAQGKYVTKGLPEGKDFKEMVWDTGLAQAAQRVADSCLFQHQQIKDDRWKSVGQNLHIYMSTANTQGADWKGVLNAWIGEYKAYRFGQKITKQNGHLTQMMWSDTKFVGCGFTSFLSNDPKFKYKKLYVCNYGPGGNIVNRLPYRT